MGPVRPGRQHCIASFLFCPPGPGSAWQTQACFPGLCGQAPSLSPGPGPERARSALHRPSHCRSGTSLSLGAVAPRCRRGLVRARAGRRRELQVGSGQGQSLEHAGCDCSGPHRLSALPAAHSCPAAGLHPTPYQGCRPLQPGGDGPLGPNLQKSGAVGGLAGGVRGPGTVASVPMWAQEWCLRGPLAGSFAPERAVQFVRSVTSARTSPASVPSSWQTGR